jgi:hypothetical protein
MISHYYDPTLLIQFGRHVLVRDESGRCIMFGNSDGSISEHNDNDNTIRRVRLVRVSIEWEEDIKQ